MIKYQTAGDSARANPLSGASGPGPVVPGDASLGILAKYSPIGHQSGFAGVQKYERYGMQSAARSILPSERISHCLRTPTSKTVDIYKTKSTGTFHYRNLQTCGSVWVCPCCAAKISEVRKKEVQQAINQHQNNGGEVYLLTLTLPHRVNQALAVVMGTLQKALNAFEKDRSYRQGFKPESGLIGRIRSFEVTYGANGWHPHFHILLFVNRITNMKQTEHDLLRIWQKVVVKLGFDEPNHHGLTLENGEKAAKYVGKWGLEHEITKGHTKRSKEGFTPFDFLRLIVGTYKGNGKGVDEFDAAILFREYAKQFKGKRQLVWSDGLRDLLHLVEEITDEEAAEMVDEDTVLFGQIPLELWKVILKEERRGELLAMCERGEDELFEYMVDIMERNGLIATG